MISRLQFFLLLPVSSKQLVDTASVPGVTPLSLRWDRDMSSYPFKKHSAVLGLSTKRYVTVVVLHSTTRC